MAINIVLLVLGVIIVLKGADWLTDGAVNIATRFGVSQMVIGLTIVAMGTSMPEFCVSMVSALKGTPDLAVGNVVGSNTLNTLLIVGCSALVAPIMVKRSSVKRDIPFAVVASLLMLLFCLDGAIGRVDAAVLFAGFCLFMFVTLKYAKTTEEHAAAVATSGAAMATAAAASTSVSETPTSQTSAPEASTSQPSSSEASSSETSAQEASQASGTSMLKAVVMLVVGLLCLIAGSNMFVDNASFVASSLGVSDAVIGLTIVAGGTSMPELATSMVSAKKGNSDIAIGNVIGSNVFNILMIIGITGLVKPMHIAGITTLDLIMMLASMLLMWFFCRTTYKVKRWEGAVLTIIYLAYLTWLIMNAV
ncbi:MAG: calcium/sodium antiporter [Prevotella sp.]|nr:calcium/sodium antiporter [Prevotella sp.]